MRVGSVVRFGPNSMDPTKPPSNAPDDAQNHGQKQTHVLPARHQKPRDTTDDQSRNHPADDVLPIMVRISREKV